MQCDITIRILIYTDNHFLSYTLIPNNKTQNVNKSRASISYCKSSKVSKFQDIAWFLHPLRTLYQKMVISLRFLEFVTASQTLFIFPDTMQNGLTSLSLSQEKRLISLPLFRGSFLVQKMRTNHHLFCKLSSK